MSKICPQCKTENEEGYSFCKKCGQELATMKVCYKCGAENEVDYAFCKNCGYELSSKKEYIPSPVKPPKPVTQKKTIQQTKVDSTTPNAQKSNRVKITLGIIGLVAVIIVGLYLANATNPFIFPKNYNENGISFNYPNTYEVSDLNNTNITALTVLNIKNPDKLGTVYIEILNNNNNVYGSFESLISYMTLNDNTIKVKKIEFLGLPAYELDSTKLGIEHSIIFAKNNKFYQIKYHVFSISKENYIPSEEELKETQQVFEFVKNSFKIS